MKARSKPTNPVKPAPDCPCGHASVYRECCGRYHAGEAAPSAESLMRSRYSAYVLGLDDYLLRTWDPTTRPAVLDLLSPPQPQWLGLKVLHQKESGDSGVVEFIARCKINGRAQRIQERSRFSRQDACWYYIDGDFPSSA